MSVVEIHQGPVPVFAFKKDGRVKLEESWVTFTLEWRVDGALCFYFLPFFVRSACIWNLIICKW